MTKAELKKMFLHEALRPEQVELLKEFAQMFYKLAGAICVNTAECPETTIALRKLQDAQQYVYLAVLKSEIEQDQAVKFVQQNG